MSKETLQDYEIANQKAAEVFSKLGLTTHVSAPIPDVRDDWPNILYNVTFSKGGKNVIVQYRLGVGHVDFKKYRQPSVNFMRLTNDEESIIHAIQRNPSASFKNKSLHASAAAKLALAQRVTVKPYEVFACVCNDGLTAHSQSFKDYCDEYGMNSDSIKDKATYDFCVDLYHQLAGLVDRKTIETLANLHAQF